MLQARLIAPIPGLEAYQNKHASAIKRLLQDGDPENGLDVGLLWDIIHFVGTPKLVALLSDHELHDWSALNSSLSPPFGKALAAMSVVTI